MEILFKQRLASYQIEELEKRIPFLSENKLIYSINYQNDMAYSMTISSDVDIDFEELSELVGSLLEDIYKIKDIPSRIVWETTKSPIKCSDQQIMDSDLVYKNANGQITLTGDLLCLFLSLDELFSSISQQLFHCKAYRFPVLLPTRTLEATGYFEHNPHQWMNVHRLKRGSQNYHQSLKGNMPKDHSCPEMTDTEFSLPPTMCYYVYDMLKYKSIENSSYTTSGRSFRYGGNLILPFERLIDFTIRETVFVGTKEYVESSVDQYMHCTTGVMDILGLAGRCETANDMFFMTDRTAQRLNIQKMLGTKYELLLNIPDDKVVAVASFNKHGNFIGKRFNIQTGGFPGNTAYSSCVGIGLERLVYACVTQTGLNNICQLIDRVKDTTSIIQQLQEYNQAGIRYDKNKPE